MAAVLCGSACKKGSTPDWDTPGGKKTTTDSALGSPPVPAPVVPASVPTPAIVPAAAPDLVESKPETSRASPSSEGLRFMIYNVENWLTMDRYVQRKNVKGAPKPESEKNAAVAILARHAPDIVGICEIGKASDLAEIQEQLKAAGLDLPHSHYTGGTDPIRHLGLLSRFPMTSTSKPVETEFTLAGQTFGINRGILDATVEARGKFYRFLGVHLKSKRDSEQGNQDDIRLNEARLLRRHIDSILKTDSAARLVVYGDFNDTRATPVVKTISGNYNDPTYLTAIPAKDSSGNAWTHYWSLNDIYSRIDFVMVTRALRKEVDFKSARIIDDPDWSKASDHRPVMAIFK